MRYFVIFRLKNKHSEVQFDEKADCRWCTTEKELNDAKRLSRFNPRQVTGRIVAGQARYGDELIGSLMIAESYFEEPELGLMYNFTKNQRWLFGAMVEKQFRGRKLFPQLLRFTTGELSRQEVDQPLAAVNPINRPSMSVFGTHAEAIVGRVFAFRIWKWVFCLAGGEVKLDRSISWDCKREPIQLDLPLDRV